LAVKTGDQAADNADDDVANQPVASTFDHHHASKPTGVPPPLEKALYTKLLKLLKSAARRAYPARRPEAWICQN
jgi:hypothetical protein